MIYHIKDLGLDGDCTLLVTGTVPEDYCDGLGVQYIIEYCNSAAGFKLCRRG